MHVRRPEGTCGSPVGVSSLLLSGSWFSPTTRLLGIKLKLAALAASSPAEPSHPLSRLLLGVGLITFFEDFVAVAVVIVNVTLLF